MLGAALGDLLGVTVGISDGVAVGITVGITDGLAVGITVGQTVGIIEGVDEDGVCNGATVGIVVGDCVCSTFRIRLLLLSAIYKFPDESTATSVGNPNPADVAAPLSPL